MIDALSKTISNEANKLMQASERDVCLSESQLEALETLCRCAKALKADEREKQNDDLEDESDEELLGKVMPVADESGARRPGLPTGGSPGCAGS